MKVSGFTFVRNGVKFRYPFKASILSILPICDEFIVNCPESEDETLSELRTLQQDHPKIKIIETAWDENLRRGGRILAHHTNLALSHCSGDWCFYLQADEVVHEKYLDYIHTCMKKYHPDRRVEGLLFKYLHFYMSFSTYFDKRPFYRREIRIIRNHRGIYSYKDAQGFRIDNRKLNVVLIDAYIYHYGWVRPESTMKEKQKHFDRYWHDDQWVEQRYRHLKKIYEHVEGLKFFTGTHPAVMQSIIAQADWQIVPDPREVKITNPLKKCIHFLEDRVFRTQIGEYRNYRIIRKDPGASSSSTQ